jgi:hypothetical protein
MPRPHAVDHALRLRTLWIAWLLATLFHVELGLMPLFHGRSADIHSSLSERWLPLLFDAMAVYFVIPLMALVLIAYDASGPHPRRRWRWLHLGLSLVYTLTNVPHVLADLLVPDARVDQVGLMLVLLLLGLLINREGWLWARQPSLRVKAHAADGVARTAHRRSSAVPEPPSASPGAPAADG